MFMKRFRNILLGMVVAVSVGNITFAAEVPEDSAQTSVTSVSEKAVFVADWEAQFTKCAEEVLKRGVSLHQAVTVNNVTLTLVSLYSDAYNYYMVVTLEKADHTAFKEIGQLDLINMVLVTKEEMATSGQPAISFEKVVKAEAISLEEMVKAKAEKDENLKQFIREDGTIDEEGIEAYYKELYKEAENNFKGYSLSCRTCQMKDSSDKKVYFLISGSKVEPMPEVMEFCANQLINTKKVKYEPKVDLIDYFKAHQGENLVTQPNEDLEREKEWLAEIKDEDPELYKMQMEHIASMPKNILVNNDLNLKLLEGKKDTEIDSIGFIEGKLHILSTSHCSSRIARYHLCMVDAAGNEVQSTSRGSSRTDDHGIEVVEEYSIFDIPNVEALSKYKLKVVGEETEIMADGPWSMEVKMEPTTEKITKTCNEIITYGSHQQAVIKELELTPLALVMKMENENKISRSEYIGTITLNMKDGSKKTLDNISAQKREGKNHLLVCTAGNNFIDTKEVVSITVRDKTILL